MKDAVGVFEINKWFINGYKKSLGLGSRLFQFQYSNFKFILSSIEYLDFLFTASSFEGYYYKIPNVTVNPAITTDTIDMSLISMFNEGP